MAASPRTLLDFLPLWYDQLQQWSLSGRLSAAAREALLLDGEPQALQDLVSQWSVRNFQSVPEIVLLSNADINGAMGAYAQSTGTIYLNEDWFATATQEAVNAVLTEELGHHLDGLLNAVDTPGDEGEYFSNLLRGVVLTDAQKAGLRAENDFGLLNADGRFLGIEYSASTPTRQWTNLLGSSSNDIAYYVTTADDGTIYVAGTTYGSLDGQSNYGGADAFVTKYNSDGTKSWTRLLGTSSYDAAFCTSTSSDGSIYAAGYTNGNLDGQINNGGPDAFVTKYNSDGTQSWTRLVGTSSYDAAYASTTASDGSVYLVGNTYGNLDGKVNNGSSDAFITKYNSNGSKAWTQLLGSSTDDYATAITTASDGSIYVVGDFYDTLNGQTSSTRPDSFLAKYDSDGTRVWIKFLDSSSSNYASALTTANDGSIYLAGTTTGNLDGQINTNQSSTFISKYNSEGIKAWSKLLGPSSFDWAPTLTTAKDGSIYLAGTTAGNLNGQINNALADSFVTRYNSDGTESWTQLIGTSSIATNTSTPTAGDGSTALALMLVNTSVTTAIDGSIYVAGSTTGNLDGQINSGGYDTFLVKYKTLNSSPTDITPSSSTFDENLAPATPVATFTTTDPDSGDTFTYSLVSGTGSTDNSAFTISGDQLLINATPNYEAKSSYSIRVRTTDAGGLYTEKAITLGVNDVKEAIRGNSFYTIVDGPSWENAETDALSIGGHLVAIGSSGENSFLTNNFNNTNLSYYGGAVDKDIYWIGLTKYSGAWKWSDGTSPTYINWGPIEPFEDSGIADRAEIVLEAYPNPDPLFWTNTAGNWNNNSDSLTPLGRYGIAEIALSLSITRQGEVKEGSGPFTTSINLSAGNATSGNFAEGANVWWKVTGITADDLALNSEGLTGSGVITNGKLDLQHSLIVDPDSGEFFEVSVFSDAGMTQQIGTTNSVLIQEESPLGLVVNTSTNPSELARAITGNSISVISASLLGAAGSVGTFSGGLSAGLAFESGIILTNGDAYGAIGPNNATDFSGFNGQNGDNLLSGLAGYDTYDATVLEFTFVSVSDIDLTFEYIFASEEYNEFTGTEFNDVFGFYLDGVNIALTPGTRDPISINTINLQSNSQYFVSNEGGAFNIQYDGFTQAIAARAYSVAAGQHTISLRIADASDGVYDSAIFIKAASLIFNTPVFEPSSLGLAYIDKAFSPLLPDSSTGQLRVKSSFGDALYGLSLSYGSYGDLTVGSDGFVRYVANESALVLGTSGVLGETFSVYATAVNGELSSDIYNVRISNSSGINNLLVSGNGSGMLDGIGFGSTATTGAYAGTFLGSINLGAAADIATLTDSAGTTAALTLNGGAGFDRLNGNASANNLILTGLDQGTLDLVSFSSIENIYLEGGNDTVTIQAGGRLSGILDGGAGSNTLIVDGIYTISIGDGGTIVVDNGSGGGGSFSGFQSIGGGGGGGNSGGGGGSQTNSLTLNTNSNVVSITGPNSGTADGTAFTNISDINLAAGDDNAILAAVGSLTGTLSGGTGTDDLTLSSAINTVVLNQSGAGTATSTGNAVSTAFNGFEIIRLDAGDDIANLDLNGTTALTTKRQLRLEGGLGTDQLTLRLNAQERQNLIATNQLAALQDYISSPSTKTLTINLLEVDLVLAGFETAVLIAPNQAPTVTSGSSASFAENSTGIAYQATATDPDVPTTLSWSLGGVDAAFFNIDSGTGAVSFKAPPNYEAPADSGSNNVYDITVTASDGSLSSTAKDVAITVTNVNEVPTDLTLTSSGILENSPAGTVIGTLSATDPDSNSIFTYSLEPGSNGSDADNALVEIVGNEVRVKSGVLIDFETNPILNLNIRVTDNGGLTYTTAVTASVIDVNEKTVIRANSLYTTVNGPTWRQAEVNSVANGGHLTTINDAAENLWITNAYRSGLIRYYIGLNDAAAEGVYQWSSGQAVTYTNWFPFGPEPTTDAVSGFADDYVELVPEEALNRFDGGWNDIPNNLYEAIGSWNATTGIAEIPLSLSITRQGVVKEGSGVFTTSINLSAGTQASGNLAEGAQVWWKITGITADDLASGALSGTGTIQNGKLDIQHSLAVDADTGEQLEVSVFSDASMTSEYQIGTQNSVAIEETAPSIRFDTATTLGGAIGIDFLPTLNSLVISANYPSGNPSNLFSLNQSLALEQFSTISGLTDELKIAAVQVEGGGFLRGDLFLGNGQDGEIIKITQNGDQVINPWVQLPGSNNGLLRGSLFHDNVGTFGFDLLAVTTTGQIWRINGQGQPTLLTETGVPLEGMSVIPNDPSRYGPLAGKLLAGAEQQQKLYIISPNGQTESIQLDIAVEDIDIVQPGMSLFGVDYANSRILRADASNFTSLNGEILLAQEGIGYSPSGLYRLYWNGSTIKTEPINLASGSQSPGQWEHLTFATFGNIPVATSYNDYVVITGSQSGTLNGVAFTDRSTIDLGLGTDTAKISESAGDVSQMTIAGGDGTDTLNLNSSVNSLSIDQTLIGTAAGTSISGFESINLLDGNDTAVFSINSSSIAPASRKSLTLDGGLGTDQLTLKLTKAELDFLRSAQTLSALTTYLSNPTNQSITLALSTLDLTLTGFESTNLFLPDGDLPGLNPATLSLQFLDTAFSATLPTASTGSIAINNAADFNGTIPITYGPASTNGLYGTLTVSSAGLSTYTGDGTAIKNQSTSTLTDTFQVSATDGNTTKTGTYNVSIANPTAQNTLLITATSSGSIDGISFGSTATSGPYAGTLLSSINLGAAADTATLNSAAGLNTQMTVEGGAGTDTLNGNANNNILVLTGENQGTLDGLSFSGFENVDLKAGDDIVYILPGGSLTGLLNGGGTKKIVYLPPGAPVPPPGGVITPPVTPPTTPPITIAPAPPGSDIDGGYNYIYLNDNANILTLTGAGSGVVDGTNFTNFYAVDLRGGADIATINAGGSLLGTLAGGDGTDTLNLNSGADALSINSALVGTAAGTTISGFESINLAGDDDTAEFIFNDISTQAAASRQSLTIDGGLGTDSIVLNLTPSEIAYLKVQGTFSTLKSFLANPTGQTLTVALSSVDLTLTGFENGRFTNNEPYGINLTPSAVNENLPTSSVAAILSTSDDDIGDTFTYSLATGTGDTDNGSFTLLGNQLFFQASPNYEVKSSYTIRLQTTDAGGLSFQQSVTLNINNLQEGPGNAGPITSSTPTVFTEGVTLSAGSISGDPDGNGTITAYQWYLNNAAISGATSASYTTTAIGFGTYKVALTYTDGKGDPTTVFSADQDVTKIDNAQGTLSAITGTGAFNEGVTLTAGTVSDDPDGIAVNPAYSYQWYLGANAITGATGSSFTVGAQGTGTYKVAVTYTDGQGYSTILTSADQVVAKIDNAQGTLSAITANGALTEGVTLTAGTISGDPDGNGTPASYQWLRNGTAIGGATSASYLIPTTGAGTYTVQVSYRDGQDYLTTLTSTATVVTAPPPATDLTPPTISSISTQGTTVILKFSETITAQTVPPTAFAVATLNTRNQVTARTISTVALDQNDPTRVILTLTGTAPASNVNLRVSYTDPTGNQATGVVQDVAGNDAASFTNRFADTFITASTTTLASQYQNLILTGNGNVNGTGNALNNTLIGNSGHNTLNGGTGADNMAGGLGNDIYVVDDVGDVVTEDLNAGIDAVHSSVTYTLSANVENLTLTGSSAISGTGNALNNVLTGNSAVNNLSGGDGSDTLIGGGGADILTGLAGADTFRIALADSRLAAFDRITDFAIGTDILDGPTAVTAANLRELGTVSALTQTGIAAVLTTANFARNGAATFSFGSGPSARTFLTINDGTAGFSSTSDGFIEITGYSGSLTNLAIV